MKKVHIILALLTYMICGIGMSYGQSSTQGREFWVALTASHGPDHTKPNSGNSAFRPYIAVSAPEPCTIVISNPRTNWSLTRTITTPNTWIEILTGTGANEIPLAQWYNADDNQPNSETPYDHGLKVSVVENVQVSVYAALWWSKSFDATNVLPVHALGSEYIVETYGPSTKDGEHQNVFTILAAEDCTVQITPNANTAGNKPANVPFTVNLLAGQVYHVKSATDQDLNGSRVKALNDKKIAVYAGCILGNVPSDIADRDLLYEELFPLDYWGRDFVVARSKEKDANRIMILAEKQTDVTIYGSYQATPTSSTIISNEPYTLTLSAGEVYEFELSAGFASGRWDSKRNNNLKGITVVDSAVYIHTECPCAVMSFDVGKSYVRKDNQSEIASNHGEGAPSMTWISPIQQMMKDVVFGVMGTSNTHDHFVNIIVKTEDIDDVTLRNNKTNQDMALSFRPVDGNNMYSYARTYLERTNGAVGSGSNPTYHLTCPGGFTASVYGNGSDESYAYTVGSSAIKRGIKINDQIFEDNSTPGNSTPFCVNDELLFDAAIGGSEDIDAVSWDFGDGITLSSIEGLVQTTHTYTSPGWYDVTAKLRGRPACSDVASTELATISFSFRVVRADTVWHVKDTCVSEGYQGDAKTLMDTVDYDCDSVVVTQNFVHRVIPNRFDATAFNDTIINGVYYDETPAEPITWTIEKGNYNGRCDSIFVCNLTIKKCLNLEISNDSAAQFACYGDTYDLPFSMHKDGDYGAVYFALEGKRAEVLSPDAIKELETVDGRKIGIITLPTESLQPGRYKATVEVEDNNCGGKAVSPVLDIAVRYPKEVFNFKFNNVLAVYKTNHVGNEGWEFREYQWYLNGEKIENAIESVYHTEEIFKPGDVYFVELTDAKGMKLRSCEFTVPEDIDHYEQEESEPAAVKTFVNRRLYIQKGNVLYDMYGQRVK